MSDDDALMRVNGLTLAYRQERGWLEAVNNVSFDIRPGEIFGLVGESGCGKSTLACQLLGYHHPRARVVGGSIVFRGRDLLALRPSRLQHLRGRQISFVPQNPATALNPAKRVGTLIGAVLRCHGAVASHEAARRRIVELLRMVGLPTPDALKDRYPHQLSGGQQQRVAIAMALSCEPDLIVLDEPTTGLDVTTQKQILRLLTRLRAQLATSMLYVTHDLGVLREIADRVAVMYAGRLVEIAPTDKLYDGPRHPYTRGLIASIPRTDRRNAQGPLLKGLLRHEELPPGCPFSPRCDEAVPSCAESPQTLEPAGPGHVVACQRWRDIAASDAAGAAGAETDAAADDDGAIADVLAVDGVSLRYGARRGRPALFQRRAPKTVVNDASFTIRKGETFALVGESGSGKSTIARAVSGLIAPFEGQIRLLGEPVAGLIRNRSPEDRRRVQYIFQNPDASLNPRATVQATLMRPLQQFFLPSRGGFRERVERALHEVRLPASYLARYPVELSGGERQRVAIARGLIAEPELLLCDEVLSALDVSVQASVLRLLRRLKRESAIAMLFISHDLAVVRSLADRVGVLFNGQLLELGGVEEIFGPPYHPYTRELLMAQPGSGLAAAEPADTTPAVAEDAGDAPGCAFAGRCRWQRGALCEDERPPWQDAGRGLRIRCHIPADELRALTSGGAPGPANELSSAPADATCGATPTPR